MKKLISSLAFLVLILATQAQQLNTPQPSPTQTVKQNFGVGSIELNYSRPSAKGRKVFGDLVPFDKVWRTGANNATVLTFSDEVTIGGVTVKAGKYGLLSIPNDGEWTLIITKDVNVNSPALYKQENDVVRVPAKTNKLKDKVETFTIQFANITNSTCDVEILWDATKVVLPISTNTDAKVMAQIDNVFNKDNKPYYAAASYYFETGKDLTQAKEWAAKAVAANPKAYWVVLLQARILDKVGEKDAAKEACSKVIELAAEAKNDDYVKMAKELMSKL